MNEVQLLLCYSSRFYHHCSRKCRDTKTRMTFIDLASSSTGLIKMFNFRTPGRSLPVPLLVPVQDNQMVCAKSAELFHAEYPLSSVAANQAFLDFTCVENIWRKKIEGAESRCEQRGAHSKKAALKKEAQRGLFTEICWEIFDGHMIKQRRLRLAFENDLAGGKKKCIKIQSMSEKMEFQTLAERQVFGRGRQKLCPVKLCARNAERCPKETSSNQRKRTSQSKHSWL